MKSKPKQKKSEKQIVRDFNSKYNTQAGKGDQPRNIFSEQYRENFDAIFCKNPKTKKNIRQRNKS